MLRGLEAIAIAFLTAITVITVIPREQQVMPGHYVSSERALAWILLVSDSAPYTGDIYRLSELAFSDHVVGVRVGGVSIWVPSGNHSVTYAVRAVWLGHNGSVEARVVEIYVKP